MPEQAFLAKTYDENARCTDCDPHGVFHTPTDASARPAPGLVGPLSSSSFSLTTVERVLSKMEGSAIPGSLGLDRRAGVPSPMLHVLQNFKSLLNLKVREVRGRRAVVLMLVVLV